MRLGRILTLVWLVARCACADVDAVVRAGLEAHRAGDLQEALRLYLEALVDDTKLTATARAVVCSNAAAIEMRDGITYKCRLRILRRRRGGGEAPSMRRQGRALGEAPFEPGGLLPLKGAVRVLGAILPRRAENRRGPPRRAALPRRVPRVYGGPDRGAVQDGAVCGA